MTARQREILAEAAGIVTADAPVAGYPPPRQAWDVWPYRNNAGTAKRRVLDRLIREAGDDAFAAVGLVADRRTMTVNVRPVTVPE